MAQVFPKKGVFAKRTQTKNVYLLLHEYVVENMTWVRSTKTNRKTGEKRAGSTKNNVFCARTNPNEAETAQRVAQMKLYQTRFELTRDRAAVVIPRGKQRL